MRWASRESYAPNNPALLQCKDECHRIGLPLLSLGERDRAHQRPGHSDHVCFSICKEVLRVKWVEIFSHYTHLRFFEYFFLLASSVGDCNHSRHTGELPANLLVGARCLDLLSPTLASHQDVWQSAQQPLGYFLRCSARHHLTSSPQQFHCSLLLLLWR